MESTSTKHVRTILFTVNRSYSLRSSEHRRHHTYFCWGFEWVMCGGSNQLPDLLPNTSRNYWLDKTSARSVRITRLWGKALIKQSMVPLIMSGINEMKLEMQIYVWEAFGGWVTTMHFLCYTTLRLVEKKTIDEDSVPLSIFISSTRRCAKAEENCTLGLEQSRQVTLAGIPCNFWKKAKLLSCPYIKFLVTVWLSC